MPPYIPTFRSMHRSSRRTSFHRHHPPDRSPFDAPDRPPPRPANHRLFLRPTRSFPNLASFVQPTPHAAQTPHTFQTPPFPEDPELVDIAPSPDLFRPTSSTPPPKSAQPLSTSTVSTASSLSVPNHPLPPPASPPPRPMTRPSRSSRNKSLLRRVSSSQRLRRLSLSHRARSRPSRCSSFSEHASPWASSAASFLSQRSDTDDSLSWSRFFSLSSSDLRDQRLWRKRLSSYSCSDFEIAEDDNLVEIGERLPDRADSIAEEDIFGRRRGDVVTKNVDSLPETAPHPGLACNTTEPAPEPDDFLESLRPKPTVRASSTMSEKRNGYVSGRVPPPLPPAVVNEEERTIENISRAIDSSRGRLRRSANMSKAFRAVIKSGEGFVRKSELVEATLNSEESKDPSMIILLHPESCDPDKSQVEGIGKASEEGVADDMISKSNAMAEGSVGFSTSMTAKQCAATLETILRDMSCKVLRYAEDRYGSRKTIRLKATQLPHGGRILDRKIRVMVTIREEDDIRTSVAFRKIAGLYSSRDSHLPLCCEIRDRFQREWPAIVEALYIRLPNVRRSASSLR